jgi:hypothetical protein
MLGVFLAGAGALWGTRWTRGRAACDQYDYHLRAIVRFARELPRPDLHDYPSATTPGYHLVLAAVARLVSENALFLQVAAGAFTIALLVVFGRSLARAGDRAGRSPLELVALAIPLVASPYVFTSGVWLLPDNAGWLLALLALWPCFHGPMTARKLAWYSVMLGLLALVRQSHVWVAAPICAAAWMDRTPWLDDAIAGAWTRPSKRMSLTIRAMLACIPGIVILAAFAREWRGLTPPSFHAQHLITGGSGINWATVPFMLALVAVFSPFYLGWLWPGIAKLWRESRPLVVLLAIGAIAWSIVPETTFQREPRSGGLWAVVGLLDDSGMVIAGHTSPLILILAPVGAIMLAAWIALIDDKRRWIVAAAVVAFIAAQSANANCWQRYHEPFLLMLFGLVAAAYGASGEMAGSLRRPSTLAGLRIAGPLALAALLAAVTVGGLLFGRDPLHPDPEQRGGVMPHDPGR